MQQSLSLNGNWKLRGFDGQHGQPEHFCATDADERTFINAKVPGEVHVDLQRAGWLEDPNIGLNTLSSRWVEEQVWVYRTKFEAPPEALSQTCWLVFDGLDLNAVVYLNGNEVGRHANAFYPCRIDVSGKLLEGENVLAVRIEGGLYRVSDKPGLPYLDQLDHKLHKRSWLRKPQNSFSWDWSPRLINVGIFKGVRLEWTDLVRIDALTVYPELADDHTKAIIHAAVQINCICKEDTNAVLRLRVREVDTEVEEEVLLRDGDSRLDICMEIANPKLWWPRPHGDQPVYWVEVEIEVDGVLMGSAARRSGIRSIRINQDKHPDSGQHFILEVNGVPVFAKGGNWVPADLIYGLTEPERYRKLVELAVDANFNTLRIWGGGLYADHALLDACDELGVLVWHDFIFACSKYPSDDVEFLNDVRNEITFVIRDLSPHPSLVVWCGNNELEWGAWDWGFDRTHPYPDYALYHLVIPKILANEDPSRPYWPSSPYSLDHRHPNDPTMGDQHPWHVTLGENGTDFWKYRQDVSRFPNEGGVLGASSPATLRHFLSDNQRRLFSPEWEFHDNACNYRQEKGVTYRAIEDWLGATTEEMSFDDYAFYSALIQGEGLQEYINNFRRRMFSSASAIFWMYNDCWPVTHGWTIIDYYLRRKLSYHPVRRSFAEVHIIPAVDNDHVIFYGVNDTLKEWRGQARFGLFKLAGGLPVDMAIDVTLMPNASTVVGQILLADWEAAGKDMAGAFAVLAQDGITVAQNRLFISRFKDLKWAAPDIRVEQQDEWAVFSSPVFVWGVTLDVDGEEDLMDDVFDLLPGIEYRIPWSARRSLPKPQRTGSGGRIG